MLTFIQITDTHVFADREEFLGARPAAILAAAVADIRVRTPRAGFVVNTGDIGGLSGTKQDYERYLGLVAGLPMPVHHVPGNHDVVGGEYGRALRGDGGDGGVEFDFEASGWRFVGWNSNERETGALDRCLQAAPRTPTFLFMHHAVLPVGVRWIDRLIPAWGLAMLNVICAHEQVRTVVSGHVHLEKTLAYRGRAFVHTPALSWQFSPAIQDVKEALDTAAPGYRVFAIGDDGAVTSEVRRLAL